MDQQDFSAEIAEYIVLKLTLCDYSASQRSLPSGFEVKDPKFRSTVRDYEMQLLKSYFRNWEVPFYGRLSGWREDSPVFVAEGDKLVGGVYLCDRNQFDDNPKWGQLHYAFMDPSYKGLGIYSVIFRTVIERARSWGLEGLYLNSDRHMLPEVYERWGAVHWKTIKKRRKGVLARYALFCRRASSNLWELVKRNLAPKRENE